MINLPTRSQLEAEAIQYADEYNIGQHGLRGDGDERDAFRHAYSSARYKAALEMPLMMYLMLLQTGQKM